MKHPWALPVEKVFSEYSVDKSKGLSSSQVSTYLSRFGRNELITRKKQSNFILFLRQFKNPMVYTLFVASSIAILLGEILDAGAILAILLLNAVIGFIQEAKANTAIEALKKLSVPRARVIREGAVQTIPSGEVVPGDILFLEAGDYVSADARIFEVSEVSVDESTLTGESLPVRKINEVLDSDTILGDRKNMIHSGTAVNSCSLKAIVTSTGMKTEMGQIAGLLEETKVEETPLQKRLNGVTKKLILLGVLVIIIVIILRYLEGDPLFLIFMSAISLAVAAIPEGLPTVVTLALTLAVRRMTVRNAIVRNMASVETLGSTDVICTDKTGTLTAGIMSARETFLLNERDKDLFIKGMILCNNASLENGGSGDSTERALLEYAFRENYSLPEINRTYPRVKEWSFDSDRKRMSVAVTDQEGTHIFVKGAPETMIERCLLSSEDKEKVRTKVLELSSKGQRILAIGDRYGEISGSADEVESNLTFLGLVALADPPKKETLMAIRECKEAGIKVVMITGDHPVTAKAIALELGIAIPGEFEGVLTGKDIEELDKEELRVKAESTAVYARVSPSHKLQIVDALQKNGHIVAMTGDGVNDAPALKKAQIGVSMGKSGTEVARQASRIILTDDNFATIVSAVEEGRAIYGNIKRTIQYLLSTNLAEILIVLGASILGLPVPFTPIGLLWINLVTDGFPSLALAAEPLDKNILKNSKRPSPSSFFDRWFLEELFFIGIVMSVICLGVYYYKMSIAPEASAKSLTFNLLVLMSLLRSFSCRSSSRTFFELPPNFYHLAAVIIPIILQWVLLEFEYARDIFQIEPLSLQEMFLIFVLSMIPPTLMEVRKLWIRRRKIS